jgi:hypothetical protein
MSESIEEKQNKKTSIVFPDLTKTFPRSPNEKMAGLVHLPRMLDKARAKENESLGEYIYPCPLDERLLTFLGVKDDKFLEASITLDESGILSWIEAECKNRTDEEKEGFNKKFLSKKPNNEKSQKKFDRIRDSIDPARVDIQTWAALIDLEEGHHSDTPSSLGSKNS